MVVEGEEGKERGKERKGGEKEGQGDEEGRMTRGTNDMSSAEGCDCMRGRGCVTVCGGGDCMRVVWMDDDGWKQIKERHVHYTWMCGDIDNIGPNWALVRSSGSGPLTGQAYLCCSQLSNVSRILFFLLPVRHD